MKAKSPPSFGTSVIDGEDESLSVDESSTVANESPAGSAKKVSKRSRAKPAFKGLCAVKPIGCYSPNLELLCTRCDFRLTPQGQNSNPFNLSPEGKKRTRELVRIVMRLALVALDQPKFAKWLVEKDPQGFFSASDLEELHARLDRVRNVL
jgi:hypothetical protein